MQALNDRISVFLAADQLNDSPYTLDPVKRAEAISSLWDWERVGTGNQKDDWFRVATPAPGVALIEEPWHDERVKSYVIIGADRAVLLDTGMGVGDLRSVVERLTDLPITVVLSHAHWDHIGSTHQFAGDADVLIHPLAAPELRAGISPERMRRYLAPEHVTGPFSGMDLFEGTLVPGVEPTGLISDGDTIDLGDRTLEVVHTPGHTAGLIALWDAATASLFSTDAAYAGALYAQMPDSDLADYRVSLTRLASLEPSPRRVYPAHGDSPIAPELLPVMREAMDRVMSGILPASPRDGVATFDFGEFSILTRWPLAIAARP